ncbi:MAG: hypothetical protein KBT27_15670 [Prevotellaceae bacterium]|nr:hypothetical protein [Candidatus Faecinaster equi]
MAYDINAALERLEKNLKDVHSAKEDVKKTVETAAKLGEIVSSYSAAFESLNKEAANLVAELKQFQEQKKVDEKNLIKGVSDSCTDSIKQFETKCSALCKSFEHEISTPVHDLIDANTKLCEKADDLSSIKNALLETTQAISQKVENIQSTVKQISEDFVTSQKEQDQVLISTNNTVDKLVETVQNRLDALSKQLEEKASNIKRESKINRGLIIALIVLAIANIVLRFI